MSHEPMIDTRELALPDPIPLTLILPEELIAARAIDFGLQAPHPALRFCVIVPARNEEESLPALVAALADQRDLADAPLDPSSFEVILLLNNCTDRTPQVARDLQRRFPSLRLHVAEISFAAPDAHVGRARQALFDLAYARFQLVGRPDGLILTTDADSRPAADWIARNDAEIALGVVGVGGRILLEPEEEAALPPGVRRFLLLDIGYRRALEELRSLYAPEAHDPFPRHHQHFGGSLATTAAAYARAGGMPAERSNEDVALYRAILHSGGRFRHSYQVRVHTSARMIGRAQGGLADALGWWNGRASSGTAVLVESAAAAEARLAQLGLWCVDHPGEVPPLILTTTPEPPPPSQAAEIGETLQALREICATVSDQPLEVRIDLARQRFVALAAA